MLNSAKRPLILAGHGIMVSGAMKAFDQFVHSANIPVAMTLLGIGCFPAKDPLNLGMMGMHGEAWVNHAIQEADLLIAVGMRFDDRVTGDLKTYARDARKIHIEIDRSEINKNVKVDSALVGDAREVLEALLPHVKHKRTRRLAGAYSRAQGRRGGARHSGVAGQRASLRGARDQRFVERDEGRSDRRDRRGPAPDVGSAVLPPQSARARW